MTAKAMRPRGQILRADIGYLGTRARVGCHLNYTVSGRGKFPEDMLRYDDVNVYDINASRGSENLAAYHSAARAVRIMHAAGVTPARWLSFGWSVHDDIEEAAS